MIFSHLIHTFSHLKTRCESALDSVIMGNLRPLFTPLHLFTIKSSLVEISGVEMAVLVGESKKGVRCESGAIFLYGIRLLCLHTSFVRCESRCELWV